MLDRAAEAQLKKHHRLVLMVRETPLHLGYLRIMVSVTETGAAIATPLPAFHRRPYSAAAILHPFRIAPSAPQPAESRLLHPTVC